MTILAPSLAISLATSAPTPRAAPVQIATRPSSMPIVEAPPKSRPNPVRPVDPAARRFVNSPRPRGRAGAPRADRRRRRAQRADVVGGRSRSGTMIVIIPAALAERTPLCESSSARHALGATPSRSAAVRNGSGAACRQRNRRRRRSRRKRPARPCRRQMMLHGAVRRRRGDGRAAARSASSASSNSTTPGFSARRVSAISQKCRNQAASKSSDRKGRRRNARAAARGRAAREAPIMPADDARARHRVRPPPPRARLASWYSVSVSNSSPSMSKTMAVGMRGSAHAAALYRAASHAARDQSAASVAAASGLAASNGFNSHASGSVSRMTAAITAVAVVSPIASPNSP